MSVAELSSSSRLARRLAQLAQLYAHGQASDLMDRTLEKLLAHEAEVSRAQLAEVRADLRDLEQRYGLPSGEFYSRYQAGQTDDRLDFVEWASLYQMAQNLEQRLKLLEGETQA